jgi:hypothetical protein
VQVFATPLTVQGIDEVIEPVAGDAAVDAFAAAAGARSPSVVARTAIAPSSVIRSLMGFSFLPPGGASWKALVTPRHSRQTQH